MGIRIILIFLFMALYSTTLFIKPNRLLKYLNSIGLQLYLCQGIAFVLIPIESFRGSLRTVLILGLTFCIASIVNWLYDQLHLISKK